MQDVEILLGIGNIGAKFVGTRHNVGFVITKKFVEKHNVIAEKKFENAKVWECEFLDKKIVVCHPTTYVNNSGVAARELFAFYGVTEEKLLVVVDDINLKLATMRFRKNGSAGGHNGLRSLIDHTSQDFARLRFGVGPLPENEVIIEFVLGRFSKEEEEIANEKIDLAVEALDCYFENGIVAAMNKYSS
ncbi:MAG: aminoacyl-tRNA hydrolase [Chitinivibrionia bacterium]|nr:aminoacyl-tRNA hydrolase [Chitinivibrionia bacterium]